MIPVLLSAFLLLVAVVFLYGVTVARLAIVEHRELVTFTLKHSLTIAVIGDFHVGRWKGERFLRRLVERVNHLKPDLILLPGDFIDKPYTNLGQLSPLQDLQAPLGVFAVFGNHDHWVYRPARSHQEYFEDQVEELQERLKAMSIQLLTNEHRILDWHGEKFAIAGIDNPGGAASLELAFDQLDAKIPLLLLAHDPDVIKYPLHRRAQLIVSGHTHGGQVRLPFWGPVPPLPTTIGRYYDQGIFELLEGTTLAITHGVGESGLPVRFCARPEILLLQTRS